MSEEDIPDTVKAATRKKEEIELLDISRAYVLRVISSNSKELERLLMQAKNNKTEDFLSFLREFMARLSKLLVQGKLLTQTTPEDSAKEFQRFKDLELEIAYLVIEEYDKLADKAKEGRGK